MVASDRLTKALSEWQIAIGQENVEASPSVLLEAEKTTFFTSQQIPAILKPGSLLELQECLRIANRFRTPVYPVSSGRNWGYGSRVPPQTGSVLLSLSRLNRITAFDEKLAYVTVEPGVTQRQLFEFLREKKSKLWMDATGSSPDCSIIGNTMERGFGHTPLGDHASYVCGFQVVLPEGEVIETGSARFEHSLTAPVVRWGAGPSLDGLFAQANLGIVTRMTVWLMPEPEAFEAFFFRCADPHGLPKLIDILQQLRLEETLRSSIHIGNDYRVLAGLQQYPWDEMNGRTPLSEEVLGRLRKKLGFGYWNVSGGLYGTKAQVSEAKLKVRKHLSGLPGSLKFLAPRTLELAKRFAKPFRLISRWDLEKTVSLVEPVIGLMRGVPTEHTLSSAYWRKRRPMPANPNPDRDRCGLLWYSPTAPADGARVEELTKFVSATLLKHGFEPAISLTLISPRAVFCIVSMAYDREIHGEDEKARNCYDEVTQLCHAHGFFPYRLGIQSPELPVSSSYTALMRRLKQAFDPNGILAPGRYEELPG